jgi:hypothetical protein
VGLIGTILFAVGEARQRDLAEHNAALARAHGATSEALARTEAAAREEAQRQATIAGDRAEALAREDYINRVNRACREVQDDNVALAEDLLHGCPPARRGWEWHYVERLCHSERLSLDTGIATNSVAFSPQRAPQPGYGDRHQQRRLQPRRVVVRLGVGHPDVRVMEQRDR